MTERTKLEVPQPESEISDEDRQTLREQYIDVYDKSQDSFDASVRTLSSAGVAVTATLGAAFKTFGGAGTVTIVCFVLSLLATLISFQTVQFDMKSRIAALQDRRDERSFTSGWSHVTTAFNWLAGLTFVAGAIALCWFVHVHAS